MALVVSRLSHARGRLPLGGACGHALTLRDPELRNVCHLTSLVPETASLRYRNRCTPGAPSCVRPRINVVLHRISGVVAIRMCCTAESLTPIYAFAPSADFIFFLGKLFLSSIVFTRPFIHLHRL